MTFEKKIVIRKIKMIEKDLENLKKIAKLSLKEYLNHIEYQAATERYLERIIMRMIDINYHILSEIKKEMPDDYYQSFVEMGKHKYLSIKLAENLANSAGLRNRLAHEYDEIDQKILYEAAQRCLKEVPQYLKKVIKLI